LCIQNQLFDSIEPLLFVSTACLSVAQYSPEIACTPSDAADEAEEEAAAAGKKGGKAAGAAAGKKRAAPAAAAAPKAKSGKK
jgi:hypothetical protein